MKTKKFLKFILTFFTLIFITSCINDGDFKIPITGKDKNYSNLKSLSEISKLYNGKIVNFKDEITTYGYVISNDRNGNFFKSIIIQDKPKNPTIGFEIRIDDKNLNARYNVGRKIYIKLKGLSLNKFFTSFQLGINNDNKINRIASTDYINFIDRSAEIANLVPTTLKIDELTDKHINTLIKINNLQPLSKGLTYANSNNTLSVNRLFNNCETFKTIILRTSGFAKFKELPIPYKKGSITGILNKFKNDYQLFIRDTNDVNLNEKYGCFNPTKETTIKQIKELFNGNETIITKNTKIKVVVTSDISTKNITNKNAFVQDSTAGIYLNFNDICNLKLGEEIEIELRGLKLSKSDGLLQLNLNSSNIINKKTGTLPLPELIDITQANSGNYESKLVEIKDVQFKNIKKNYEGENILSSDCTNELNVYVNSQATFANNPVSNKKGSITGILFNDNGIKLYLRNESDINFTKKYNCDSSGGNDSSSNIKDLFFSEYSEGSSSNKYIEIYNGTNKDIDLSPYKIELYTNGKTDKPRLLDLSTISNKVLIKGDVLVIYNSSANDIIKNQGDVESNVTWFNGDDALFLKKNDVVIDVIGKVGEDPGSGWQVAGIKNATKDRTLIRKKNILKGNTNWISSAGTDISSSEWIVKNKDDFSSVGKR